MRTFNGRTFLTSPVSAPGHMLGSNMFMLNMGKKVLYTGDFCPQDRLDIEGARPQKCDVLIIESTYGNPRYRFPDRNDMIGIIRDWVEDTMGRGYSAVMQAYPLGKSQELISMLKDYKPHLHGSGPGGHPHDGGGRPALRLSSLRP